MIKKYYFCIMQYHLEVLQIINTRKTAFCRVYAIYDNKIRQFINCPVNYFHTGKNLVFENNEIGASLVIDGSLLTIKGMAIDDIKLELIGCRSGKYENESHNTSCIINSNLPDHLLNIIKIDNIKLKERLNN